MNPDVQKALVALMGTLTSAADQAGMVAKAQLPLVITEYLRWGFWDACIRLSASLIILVILGVFIRWTGRNAHRWLVGPTGNPLGYIGTVAAVILGLITLFAGVMGSVATLVQISIAPRIYLLQQLKGLL